jgi:hypothetical protein
LLATALVCLAAGCPGPPAAKPPPKPFALHYARSGGLKPVPQELTIRPGRRAVASILAPRVGRRTARFRISRRKVASLKRGLRRARFFGLSSSDSWTCPDCFRYSIAYRGHEVAMDQSSMPAKLGELVTEIEALIYAHTIPPNVRQRSHLPFH